MLEFQVQWKKKVKNKNNKSKKKKLYDKCNQIIGKLVCMSTEWIAHDSTNHKNKKMTCVQLHTAKNAFKKKKTL